MAINYKNVVSVQKITGITSGISGYTLANSGVSGDVGFGVITSPQNIIKHRGFVLVPNTGTGAMTVFPTFFGADGNTLAGHTLTAGGALGTQYPLEVPLRMKTYTGLTGGSILFVV
jgi:hypothetical protein